MYQVLARKYRPKNFSELVGQTHVSRALMGALDKQRLHHAYLFTGTRGVGKTTIARILSKCLNCETGITNNPCGVCGTCKSIDAGQFIDLIEIDAASRTKVEDTRELLDQVPYAPTQGRYKVYLIDEVHMLSTHSFNALLKTLEEPPEHVKFLLATTDPQKLPITVMSRCLQFVLRPLPRQDIHDHLQKVLTAEDITFDDAALWKLAESAQGSIRDSLSLTDQAIAYGQGAVRGEDVDAMLGLIDAAQVNQLLANIHSQNKAAVAAQIHTMREQMVDAKAVLDQFVELLYQLALLRDLPELNLSVSDSVKAELVALAQQIDAADLQLYYQIAVKGRDDLKMASNPQQGLEMTILRLLAFKPLGAGEMVLPNSDSTQSTPASDEQGKKKLLTSGDETTASAMPVMAETFEKSESVEVAQPEIVVETVTEPIVESASVIAEAEPKPPVIEDYQEAQPDSFDDYQSESISQSEPDVVSSVEPLPTSNHLGVPVQQVVNNAPIVDTPAPAPAPVVQFETTTNSVVQPASDSTIVDNPLDLLNCPLAELTGQWTLEKWEYWLRHAELIPAVTNLAHKGVMQGEIGKTAQLHITPDVEKVANEFFARLQERLQQDFPEMQTTFTVVASLDATPEQKEQGRRLLAQQAAEKKVMTEPLVQQLMGEFDATVACVSLKA